MYLPAALASQLASSGGAERLRDLDHFLRAEGLLPFTYNAFPHGGFQTDGLKDSVYRPDWSEPARFDFTRDVARVAVELARGRDLPRVSISTHPGGFAPWGGDRTEAYALGLARAVAALESLEKVAGAPRFTLSVEAEPRASSGDGAELAGFLRFARTQARDLLLDGSDGARRLLGTCLDACHAAVEFEDPREALEHARVDGGQLGKLQFSSALSLDEPARHPQAIELLLGLDEPRFLHQVTGRGPDGILRTIDLPELEAALGGPQREAWLSCDSWRCHFHVPVDRERFDLGERTPGSAGALGTTRATAEELLTLLLQSPESWGDGELHVEIETYTWSVLPEPERGPEELVDGLEGEYRFVLSILAREGWYPVHAPSTP